MNRRVDIAVYSLTILMLLGAGALWWQGIAPRDEALVLKAEEKMTLDAVMEDKTKDITGDTDINIESFIDEPADIYVHVAGAVKSPGVYCLKEGQRVFEAVQMAVAEEDADLDMMNLALKLSDSQRIYVPRKGEIDNQGRDGGISEQMGNPAYQPSFPIDINTASRSELDLLPGIGPALADAIITYRQNAGGFTKKEDIVNVPGIGPKSYEKLEPLITVDK
jgi:competence protein ComEA